MAKEQIYAKLVRKATPSLEAGEQVQVVFGGQGGPSPWLVGGLLALVFGIYGVVVTDRRLLFMSMPLGAGASKLKFAVPRSQVAVTQWDPRPLWSVMKIQMPDGTVRRLNVHRRFRAEADKFIAMTGAPPSAPPQAAPPPAP